MNFSEKIQKLRKEKGFTQEELAEKLNISRQSVSKWESGQGMPETDKTIQLSKLLDVSIDYLLKDDSFIHKEVTTSTIQHVNQVDKKFSRSFIIGLVFLSMSFIGLLIFWILSDNNSSRFNDNEGLNNFLLILFCSIGLIGLFLILYKKISLSLKTKIIISIAIAVLVLLFFIILYIMNYSVSSTSIQIKTNIIEY